MALSEDEQRLLEQMEAAGRALYWSTLGSFLGSVTLSLFVMQAFGVWAAVLLGALMLVAGAMLVQRPTPVMAGLLVGVLALGLLLNLRDRERIDTAYADYEVLPVERDGMISPRAFVVNNQYASLIDDEGIRRVIGGAQPGGLGDRLPRRSSGSADGLDLGDGFLAGDGRPGGHQLSPGCLRELPVDVSHVGPASPLCRVSGSRTWSGRPRSGPTRPEHAAFPRSPRGTRRRARRTSAGGRRR